MRLELAYERAAEQPGFARTQRHADNAGKHRAESGFHRVFQVDGQQRARLQAARHEQGNAAAGDVMGPDLPGQITTAVKAARRIGARAEADGAAAVFRLFGPWGQFWAGDVWA